MDEIQSCELFLHVCRLNSSLGLAGVFDRPTPVAPTRAGGSSPPACPPCAAAPRGQAGDELRSVGPPTLRPPLPPPLGCKGHPRRAGAVPLAPAVDEAWTAAHLSWPPLGWPASGPLFSVPARPYGACPPLRLTSRPAWRQRSPPPRRRQTRTQPAAARTAAPCSQTPHSRRRPAPRRY